MSDTSIIVLLFAVDVGVHLIVTVIVGRWLNRRAVTAVASAAETVGATIRVELPHLAGPLIERVIEHLDGASG